MLSQVISHGNASAPVDIMNQVYFHKKDSSIPIPEELRIPYLTVGVLVHPLIKQHCMMTCFNHVSR